MNGVFTLDEYHNNVLGELKKIGWAKTVGIYPEFPDDFETPAIFFNVANWNSVDTKTCGALSVELSCNIFLMRGFDAPDYHKRVRNAALTMTAWIEGRVFGPGMQPAEFENVEPVYWEKDGTTSADHACWCVSYSQIIGVGADPFDYPSDGILKQVFVGFAPEIGAEHEKDYYGPIGR